MQREFLELAPWPLLCVGLHEVLTATAVDDLRHGEAQSRRMATASREGGQPSTCGG